MQLTPRETEVLALLKTGRKTSECAAELGITLGTWKVYCSHVYRALGVSGRFELMGKEIENRAGFP